MKLLLPLAMAPAMVLAALAGAANALPNAQPISIIDGGANFTWKIQPSATDISQALDGHAAGNTPVNAATTIECTLNKSYRPDDCKIIEQPANSTLGQGAIDVAKQYRALSKDEAGNSTIGRKVRLQFAWGGS